MTVTYADSGNCDLGAVKGVVQVFRDIVPRNERDISHGHGCPQLSCHQRYITVEMRRSLTDENSDMAIPGNRDRNPPCRSSVVLHDKRTTMSLECDLRQIPVGWARATGF